MGVCSSQVAPVPHLDGPEAAAVITATAAMAAANKDDLEHVDTAVTRLMTLLHVSALRSLLNDPRGRTAFEAFLQREVSYNNLKFYDTVTALISGGGCNIDVGDIVKKYIEDGSDEQVNLTHNIRRNVEKSITAVPVANSPTVTTTCTTTSSKPGPTLLDFSLEGTTNDAPSGVLLRDSMTPRKQLGHAAEEILRMMAFDSMPRFLRSPEYKLFTSLVQDDDAAAPLWLELQSAAAGTVPTLTNVVSTSVEALSSKWLKRFIGLASILPACITIADMDHGIAPLVYVNPTFLATTGYSFAEATGRNCSFLQGPDTEPAAVEKIRAAIRASAEIRVTLTNYKKDGTPFQNFLALVPVFHVGVGGQAQETARYFLGIQFAVGTDFSPSKLVALDSIIGLLPRTIQPSSV